MGDVVLFLDFDGVLNDTAFVRAALADHGAVVSWSPEVARATLDPARVARVQAVCDATGAAAVLVTGWRRWAPVDSIADCLHYAGLTAPVLGAVGTQCSTDCRAMHAERWLDEHPEVRRWCVLDDAAQEWSEPRAEESRWRGRVVSPSDGVTEADAARVVAILTDQRAWHAVSSAAADDGGGCIPGGARVRGARS